MTRRALALLRDAALLIALAAALLLALTAAPLTAQVRPGQGVSIDLRPAGAAGELLADEIEILPAPRSLKLRGAVEEVDVEGSRIRMVGWWLAVDADTQVESANVPLDLASLDVGRFIEVKLRARAGGWYASSAEVDDIKPSPNLKGTVRDLSGDAKPYLLWVGDVPVRVDAATDFESDEDPILDDLFANLTTDDVGSDDRRYGVALGRYGIVSGNVRGNYRDERAFTLLDDDRRALGEPGLRLEGLAFLGGGAQLFTQVRVNGQYEFEHERSSAGPAEPGELALQVRQLYVSARDLAGAPVGVVIGKQRLRDSREFLFDEYLDAARVYVYPFRPLVLEASVIHPVVPLKGRFESWTDLFLQARLYLGEDWQARLYTLQRDDTDSRRRNSRYHGLSVDGKTDYLKLWFEGSVLGGEDKGRRQEAWAMDGGVSIRFSRSGLRPSVTAGYAVGSGGRSEDGSVSKTFRQTGYEDNSSRMWGVTNFQHYGEILDPELTNLEIVTAGFGIRPVRDVSIDMIWHDYRLHTLDDELMSTGLHLEDEEVLNGDERQLGSGVDLVLGVRDLIGRVSLGYRLGTFRPGRAFESAGDLVLLQRVEFRVEF